MPALAYVKLTDRLACQGGVTTYGTLATADLVSATDVQAIDDQESARFQYTRTDAFGAIRPITAQLRAGRVCTFAWDDGSFDEWRVGIVEDGRGQRGLVTVSLVPLWLDLVERADAASGRGWVSDVPSAGVRNFEYQIANRTPSSILSTYVIPACPSWVTLGTVDPTAIIADLTVSRLTPAALTLAVRDALRAMDVICEVRLRRNGTTDYKLDLVTQVAASANMPVFHPSTALLSLRRKLDPTLQSTRALVKGGAAPDGLAGILGRARWRGAAPSGLTIALTDRNGGASPIAFDNQWVGASLYRCQTGRTFPITATNAAAGTVTVSGTVSSIAADEDFEFRLTEPLTNTRTTTTRYAVSAVPDGTHITCNVSAPLAADNQYTDWYARVWTLATGGSIVTTTRIASSVRATQNIAVASSTGVTNTHFVEFVQLDGAGEIPSYVDHPTYTAADPTGYGIKVVEVLKDTVPGIPQLVLNAAMRTWTNSANPPDGYTYTTTGSPTVAQNTTPTYTRYGNKSIRAQVPGGSTLTIQSAPVYPTITLASTRLSIRCSFYLAAAGVPFSGFNVAVRLSVYELDATGALATQLGTIQSAYGYQLNGGAYSDPDPRLGTWITSEVAGLTLTGTSAPYGLACVVLINSGTTSDIYVDTVEAYPFLKSPTDVIEFGNAQALTQAGNRQLRDYAAPPAIYDITVRDLARAFPSEFGRLALTIGGLARAADVEYGIDVIVRLLRIERDLLNALNSRLTLGNRPVLLSNTIARL